MGQSVWKKEKYYLRAREASEGSLEHPGLRLFREVAKEVAWVLEVGVGEGSKLASIVGSCGRGVGVDVSWKGLEMAKIYQISDIKYQNGRLNIKENPEFSTSTPLSVEIQNPEDNNGMFFIQADGGRLPFRDNQFDFVYSAFTLEHLEEPEKVVAEMIRVVRSGGRLGFLAPNFGAPNQASPCFRGSRIKKLVGGLMGDLRVLFRIGLKCHRESRWILGCGDPVGVEHEVSSRSDGIASSSAQGGLLAMTGEELEWNEVQPIATEGEYEIDWDTVVEPYVISLVWFLESRGIELEVVGSCWQIEQELPVWQKPIKFLGRLGIYPFKYWGPHLLVIGCKL